MGHCDSSAQLDRDGQLLSHHARATEPDSSRQSKMLKAAGRQSRSIAAALLLALLQVYKVVLSPVFGGACKYHPSCSNYATQAIETHGARRGSLLALKRLLRCRPFKQGGFDPVPSVDELNRARLRSTELEPLR
jgi:uncharacterized protein